MESIVKTSNNSRNINQAIISNLIIVEPETKLLEAIALLCHTRQSCPTPSYSQSEVEEISPNHSILESIQTNYADYSCLFAIEGQQLVGVLTERDLVKIAAESINLDSLKVADVMTGNSIALKESEFQDIFTVINLFSKHKIRHLPIVNEQNQLVGLVTPESIRKVMQPTDLLKWLRVEEVMTRSVICADSTTSLKELAKLMANELVSCVVITEETTPEKSNNDKQFESDRPRTVAVGIVTERDIVQFQALELNFAEIQAGVVMSQPVFEFGPKESLWTAHQEMQRRGVRRFVVCGDSGEMLGIITQTSILRGMDNSEMYGIIQGLSAQVRELQADNIYFLEQRNQELEIEVKRRSKQIQKQSQIDRFLAKISWSICQSWHLEKFLHSTVTEVQELLDTDRVLVYRFDSKGRGTAIAESVNQEVPSLMGQEISQTCLPKLLEEYQNGWVQAIENIHQADLDLSQIDRLADFSAIAHLIVPIVQGKDLWGLLVAQQCSQSRSWQDWEIDLLEKIAPQVAIATHQAELCQQVQTESIARETMAASLKREHKFVSAVLDTVGSLVVVVDRDGHILRFNKACEAIAQYSWEEVQGQCVWDLFLTPEEVESVKAVFGEILNGKVPKQYEAYWVTKAGDRRCILWSNTAIFSPSGTVEYVIATGLDITDRQQAQLQLKKLNEDLENRVKERTVELENTNKKLRQQIAEREKAQRALQEEKDKLQAVLDAVPGCISWIRSDLRYFGVNQHLANLFELPCEAFIGQEIGSLNSDYEFAEYARYFFASSVEKSSFEFQLYTKGKLRIYLIVAQKYHQNQAAVFVGLDITDHKQVAEALRESEERYRLVLEAITEGIVLQEASGKIVACNQKAQEILELSKQEIMKYLPGYPTSKVQKKAPNFWFLNPAWQTLRENGSPFPIQEHPFQVTLATSQPQLNVVMGLKNSQGKLKWILVNSQPVFKQSNPYPYGVVASFSEITDRKIIEEKLCKSETEMRALFGAMTDLVLEINCAKNKIQVAPTNPAILYKESTALIINQTIQELIDGKQRNNWLNKISEAIQTQQTVNFDYPLYIQEKLESDRPTNAKNNAQSETQEIWFSASISAMTQDSVIWVARDIRKRKQAEKEKNELIKSLQDSQRLIQKVAETNPNIVYIYDLKQQANVYVNRAISESLGYSATEIQAMGANLLPQILHPEDVERIKQHHHKCAALENSQIMEIEYRLKDSQNEWHWFYSRDTVFLRDEQGVPWQILGTATDITSRKQAEAQLQEANETLKCWVAELEVRNQDMALLAELNDFLQACLSLKEAYSTIATLVQPMFPESSGAVYIINSSNNLVEQVNHWGEEAIGEALFVPNQCWALRRGRPHWVPNSHSGLLCQHIHPPRSPIQSVCIPMMAQGKSLGLLVLATQQPISSAKQQLARTVAEQIALALGNLKLRETLQHQSIRDPLTGLFNRRYLKEFLDRELSLAQRIQKPIGILILDVDHFKRFNDTFGHEAGDLVLRELGHLLHGHIRNSDIASRYGGEEFMVIFPGSSVEDTRKRAEELRQEIKTLNLQYRSQLLGKITVSIGVACFPDIGRTYDELFREADAALYRAKAQGRDRVVIAGL